MICPKCGWTESNQAHAKQTEEEFFMQWWSPTIGEEAAKASWLDKLAMKSKETPMIMPDIKGHVSMADGTWISSRSKHRENLKRNNCIEIGDQIPSQHKTIEFSRKEQEARKRQIAEITYSKLNYR